MISLPEGNYLAQFESPSYEYSNIVDFTIEQDVNKNIITESTVFPFIDKLTPTSAIISSGDYSHDTLSYLLQGGIMQQVNIGKKPAILDNLAEDRDYTFYTNKNARAVMSNNSEILICKTHKESLTAYDLFLDFIDCNRNLILTSYETIKEKLVGYDYEDYLSLIDLVLSLPDGDEKQELLIFANILNKQLIDSYNYSNNNIITETIHKNFFDTVISFDGYTKAYYYRFNNFKSSLEKSVNPTEEDFCAKVNKHYCVQGVVDGVKTVKYDFAICHPSSYEKLKKYCDVEKYRSIWHWKCIGTQ